MKDPTERFSDRVDAYVRSRPSYPPGVVELLRAECGMKEGSIVADVGSGTGIFTRLLIDAGCTVCAVEPNAAMRQAAEREFAGEARFRSIEETAERTGLGSATVDLITATQSFHWFDRGRARGEFERILRPDGPVAIVWNERLKTVDKFHSDYERLLQTWGIDYARVDHSRISGDEMRRFFAPQPCRSQRFENAQVFDEDGLRSRLLSSSFAPNIGNPGCAPMLDELAKIFRRHSRNGAVVMRYETVVYYGRLR